MKVDKYDRQIRLWGADGQRRLGEAKVALLNCSGAGVEALKNLVLPGVGHIDIWDQRKIELSDLSGCFFYAYEDVGKFRAEVACANLIEMNPDVKGSAFVRSPKELIVDQRNKLKEYTLVVVGDVGLEELKLISRVCWQESIPAVFVSVVGFFIYIRSQKQIHTVEFQRTAAKKYYMRLHDPFEELVQHSKKWDLLRLIDKLQELSKEIESNSTEENDSHLQQRRKEKADVVRQLGQIPYPIILLQLYHSLPEAQRNKSNIVEQIKVWEMILGEGHRDNFTQAATRFLDIMQTPDNFLRGLDRFESEHVLNATKLSEPALILLKACKKHLDATGHLPQPVDLPDMQTETKLYIELKSVYRVKHQKDLDSLESIIRQFCDGELPTTINRKKLSNYVNNLEALQVMTLQPYYAELEKASQGVGNDMIKWIDYQGQWRNVLLVLRAWMQFESREGRVPTLADKQQVSEIVSRFRPTYGFDAVPESLSQSQPEDPSFDARYLSQILRVEGQTTISLNSIAGALAGQEATKLITHCFTPVKNGFLFSGVDAKGFSVQI